MAETNNAQHVFDQQTAVREERNKAEARFYYNELESLRSKGVEVGEYSAADPVQDLEFRLVHTKQVEAEKQQNESVEDLFKLSLKLVELGNRRMLGNVLPLQGYSRSTEKEMAKFRPALHRIASLYMSPTGGLGGNGPPENPIMQLGRLMLVHTLSFCITKMLRGGGDEPSSASAAPVGPSTSRRPVLAGP